MFGGSPNGSGDNTLSCHWPNVFGCLPQEQVHCLRYLRHIPRVVPHGLALQRTKPAVGVLACHHLPDPLPNQLAVERREYRLGRLDLRRRVCPHRVNCRRPSAFTTASRSRMSASWEKSLTSHSDRPVPRLS